MLAPSDAPSARLSALASTFIALVAVGWGVGLLTFVLVLWLSSHDIFRRVEYALLASSITSLLAFAVALQYKLRSGVKPDRDSMMDAITDMPFEM